MLYKKVAKQLTLNIPSLNLPSRELKIYILADKKI